MSDPAETEAQQPQPDPHLAALVKDITGLAVPKVEQVEKKLEEAVAAQTEEQQQEEPQGEQPAEQKAEAGQKPDDQPPAEEKKPEEQKPEEPKVEVKKPTKDRVKELVATALREIQAKTKQEAQPPKQEEKKPEPKADDFAHLSPEDREELELVRLGAAEDPKFQTLAKRLESFHAADKAKRQALLQADPERTLDENDQEYSEWSSKRPRLTINDAIRLSRKASESQLDKKLEERLARERQEIEEKVVASEAKPILAQRAEQFGKLVFETVADKPTAEMAIIAEAIKSGADLMEVDPFFGEIVQRELTEAQSLGTAFIAVTTRAEKFNPANPAHAALAEFVNGQDEYFKAHGGDARVINGRTFMTRREFAAEYAKDPSVVDRAWTTSDDQVLRSIAYRAKMMAESKVKAKFDQLSKAGFQRQKKPSEAQQAKPQPEAKKTEVAKPPQQEPKNPPAIRATAAPGALSKSGGVDIPKGISDSELRLLAPV